MEFFLSLLLAGLLQPADRPMAVVRIVGPGWTPLPGEPVQITEVNNCGQRKAVPASVKRVSADRDGIVKFEFGERHFYTIEAGGQGGFERRQLCVWLPSGPVAYVGLELREDLSQETVVLDEPSVDTRKGTAGRVTLLDLVGVYADASGRYYKVNVLDGTNGLTISTPDGAEMTFPMRSGTHFSGPSGILDFRIEAGRVAGLSIVVSVKRRTKTERPPMQ